jgi:hypothetical protein
MPHPVQARGRPKGRLAAMTSPLKSVSREVRKGEVGCLFDEIQDLVEPTERLHMAEQHYGERRHRKCRPVRERSGTRSDTVQAGPQRSRMPERHG